MFTVPQLPYGYNALEPYIDEATMKIHHDLHHGAYVKNLNDTLAGHDELLNMSVEKLIQSLDQVPEGIRTKVRNNAGGHYNHSLFWTLMEPASVPMSIGTTARQGPTGKLLEALNASFGSVEQFKEKFAAAAMGRFGSGWAWVVVEDSKLAIVDTPNQDSPEMEGRRVILGLDVWEHAYYLRYQNRRADYIANWWHVVNWEEVAKRFV